MQPDDRLATCGHKAVTGVLCPSCADTVRRHLTETIDLVVHLHTYGVTYDRGEKVAIASMTSHCPADTNLISLLDRRSGITHALATWADDIRDHLNLAPATYPEPVGVLIDLHLGWLPWVTQHHPAADEYAADIRHHHRQLHEACHGAPRRITLGRCPTIFDDDTACDTDLVVDPASAFIRCGNCRVVWPHEQWRRLGLILQSS